jgi:hypothetical protein
MRVIFTRMKCACILELKLAYLKTIVLIMIMKTKIRNHQRLWKNQKLMKDQLKRHQLMLLQSKNKLLKKSQKLKRQLQKNHQPKSPQLKRRQQKNHQPKKRQLQKSHPLKNPLSKRRQQKNLQPKKPQLKKKQLQRNEKDFYSVFFKMR